MIVIGWQKKVGKGAIEYTQKWGRTSLFEMCQSFTSYVERGSRYTTLHISRNLQMTKDQTQPERNRTKN